MAAIKTLLLIFSCSSLLILSSVCEAQTAPPLVKGLNYTFYKTTCPNLESIITKQLKSAFSNNSGLAAGLLRLHFHDCFVQSGGPNYSVPLGRRDSATFATANATTKFLPSPKSNVSDLLAALALNNLTVNDLVALSGGHTIGIGHCASFNNRLFPSRDSTMDPTFFNNLRLTCPTNQTVNTTNLDVRTPNTFDNKYYVDLVNRQGLFTSDQDMFVDSRTKPISGGPNYKVPLGRRDGTTFATVNDTLKFLPSPISNVTTLLSALALNNLDVNDLVALSGGHTIGIGHCTSFENRLFPTRDSNMNQTFFKNLRLTCPVLNTTNHDLRTPNIFDNKYYVDLMNRQELFTSDQGLNNDSRTKPIVLGFAINQSLFFEKFVFSMVKMGMLNVLTGTSGQIRANCSAKNPGTVGDAWSVVDLEVGSGGSAAAY
ncbi:Peroxidase 12 [Acorus calamus]|uniref:peroxidase n=1 Tax=Acorus calamus TaxID=4465 RepID=A0AAV9DI80_ACOCL|nr:Peroxidase 12 [Acorus calamus]